MNTQNMELVYKQIFASPDFLQAYYDLKAFRDENGPEKFMDLIYSFFDAFSEQAKSHITCTKGCSFCCHDKIFLTKTESLPILEYIKEHNIKPDRILAKKQQRAKDFFQLKWKDRKCPFLDKDQNCSIYPVRPIICRSHNSIEDPIKCKPVDSIHPKIQQAYSKNMLIIALAVSIIDLQDISDLDPNDTTAHLLTTFQIAK